MSKGEKWIEIKQKFEKEKKLNKENTGILLQDFQDLVKIINQYNIVIRRSLATNFEKGTENKLAGMKKDMLALVKLYYEFLEIPAPKFSIEIKKGDNIE